MMKLFLKSIHAAMAGLMDVAKREKNFRIEVLIGLLVVTLGAIFRVSSLHWIILLLNIGAVLGAEMFNTAIEVLCDMVQPEYDHRIKFIKDVSAAAVLVLACIAASCGTIIFFPYIIKLLAL
jgi:diacylglycerol kinase